MLVLVPGIEPTPPALEAQSLNHWTAREVPLIFLMKYFASKLEAHTWKLWYRRSHSKNVAGGKGM